MFPRRLRLPVVNLAATTPAGEMVGAGLSEATPVSEIGLTVWTWRMITRPDEIEDLAEDWHRLLSKQAAPFQTFGWITAWYRHFADRIDEVLVFVASRSGRPAAIFPCYRRGREIRMAGDLSCDYQDVIATGGDREAIRVGLRLFSHWVRRQRKNGEFFFEKISDRGLLYPVVKDLDSGRERTFRFISSYGPCPWVNLPESLEAWLSSMPRKRRGDFRRALNRLDREHPESEVSVLKGGKMDAAEVREAAAFHALHFRGEGRSPLEDARLIRLLEEVSEDPEIGLRVSRLQAASTPLAIDIGFHRGDTYFGYLMAFDEAYSRLAPGKCLLLKRVDRWTGEDEIRCLDFLCGGERYKGGFTEGDAYHVVSARLMPRTVPGAAKMIGLQIDQFCRWLGKKVLRKLPVDTPWGKTAAGPGRGSSESSRRERGAGKPDPTAPEMAGRE